METLRQYHHGKCCYCERKRDPKRESDVDHFRPKSGVHEDSGHPGYWWLAYEWTNYLYACKTCNEAPYKGSHFPISGTRAGSPDDDLTQENPVLINPVEENPEDFIDFVWSDVSDLLVKAVGVDERGRGTETIKIIGLNRRVLMEERADLLPTLHGIRVRMDAGKHWDSANLVSEAADDIRRETGARKLFAGLGRAYFKRCGMAEYIATD
ncbi:MAG: hypothetical protein IIA89_11380 [Chloroflexi bacterium]|nr:hypothetical protein [Chloroflexota bacterium]